MLKTVQFVPLKRLMIVQPVGVGQFLILIHLEIKSVRGVLLLWRDVQIVKAKASV